MSQLENSILSGTGCGQGQSHLTGPFLTRPVFEEDLVVAGEVGRRPLDVDLRTLQT